MITPNEHPSFEFSEHSIIDCIVRGQQRFCTSYDVVIPNCFTQHDNEADLLAIRKSGLCDEFEVKVSRSDFLNDAKKVVCYREPDPFNPRVKSADRLWLEENQTEFKLKKAIAPWQKIKHQALIDGDMPCNYFWYVLKHGIAELEEIPDFAGVFFVLEDGTLQSARAPKKLHSNKLDYETRFKLSRKLGYRFWEYRFGKRK